MIGRSEEELISLHQKHQLEWPSPHFHPRGYLSKKKSPLSTSSPRHLPPPPPQHRWRAMILECYYKFQCCLATGWWITIGAERGGDLTLFMRVSVCAYVCVCVCVIWGEKGNSVCVCVHMRIRNDWQECVQMCHQCLISLVACRQPTVNLASQWL